MAKVHGQGKRYVAHGRVVILVGHAGHPEVEGTMGQVPGPVLLVQTTQDVERLQLTPDTPVAYVTQTTLSVDDTRAIIAALKARFTDIVGPDINDICYATQNRQTAVRELAKQADVILVVGAKNSSNSNRLREIGVEAGVPSYLIADGGELEAAWVREADVVGITAGASAPEELVDDVVAALGRIAPIEVSALPGIEEKVEFRLPAELLRTRRSVARRHLTPLQRGHPFPAEGAHRRLHRPPAPGPARALSAGAHARAVVPLQPRLRRLRQDRLSRRDPRPAAVRRAVSGGSR